MIRMAVALLLMAAPAVAQDRLTPDQFLNLVEKRTASFSTFPAASQWGQNNSCRVAGQSGRVQMEHVPLGGCQQTTSRCASIMMTTCPECGIAGFRFCAMPACLSPQPMIWARCKKLWRSAMFRWPVHKPPCPESLAAHHAVASERRLRRGFFGNREIQDQLRLF